MKANSTICDSLKDKKTLHFFGTPRDLQHIDNNPNHTTYNETEIENEKRLVLN